METLIGQRIKEIRKTNKISQEEFGKRFNVGKSTVSQWETGKYTPDSEILNKICDWYGVTMDYLYGRSNKPHLTQRQERELNLEALIETAAKLRAGEFVDVPQDKANHMADYIEFQIQRIKEELNALK